MLRLSSRLRPQLGTSLIEVLVAVLLLSFAMLAMANLHATSLKYVKMSEFRGIATALAFEMSDRMRANSSAAGQYVFTTAYTSTAAVVATPTCANALQCSPAEMAQIDLAEMRTAIVNALPGGFLRITRDAANPSVMNVWVIWLDPDGNDATTLLPCPFTATPQPQCLAMRVAL